MSRFLGKGGIKKGEEEMEKKPKKKG